MADKSNNRPAEIFGYPVLNRSDEATSTRERHWCPFQDRRCNKKSRLITFPFGVCSAEHSGKVHIICPHRFDEQGSIDSVSKVLEDISGHYFGSLDNIVAFSEVRLPGIGNVDFVLVQHKPMKPEVEDFVSVEYQADSTTSTGGLVQGIRDFFDDADGFQDTSYGFGMNTYDSIKRAVTQLINKGVVYESWNAKCYWVMQEYIYENLISRYGLKSTGFSDRHASRFALYNLAEDKDELRLQHSRYISTSVDEVYQAMRNNPNIPDKDNFVSHLNTKLRLSLSMRSS